MDLSSPSLSEKARLIDKNDCGVYREDNVHFCSDVVHSKDYMVQRCVIIQRDEKGYGLTVSGDNPVFVQSVREDGAAARAGVQQGDRVIEVNGTLVTQSNHQEVVELIKSGSLVALTLLGRPPSQIRSPLSPQPSFHVTGNTMNILNSGKSDSSDRITSPQPVDPEKQQQLTNSRIHTIRKMLEKEMVYLENLRTEFSKSPSEKIRSEMNGAVKRVKTLEDQLVSLTGTTHEHIIARMPKSPPTNRHSHQADRESFRSISFPSHVSHNRLLTHQISAPVLPAHQITSPTSPEKYQVHLSPASEKEQTDSPGSDGKTISTSLENIAKNVNTRTTTWPQHVRNCSSPDSLRSIENLKCQNNNGLAKNDGRQKSPNAVSPAHVRSLSSISDIKSNTSRIPSFGQYDSAIESPDASPSCSPSTKRRSAGETSQGDDTLLSADFETSTELSSEDLGVHPVISKLNQNTNIICMEDDDFSSDTEMGHMEDHGPFNGLWKLVRNPPHLSVFLHYLMSNSDPSSLFFYLISEMYKLGTQRDMKKWAYEIHSSFLVPGAPLKVSLVDETILHEIDEVLQNHIDKEETLRNVFGKARKKAKEELNDLLADFRNKRTMGLANIFGPPDYQLEEATQDKNKEAKIIEHLLIPCLEIVSDEMEGVDDRTLAKTYALATVLKQYGVPQNNPQLARAVAKCPSFVWKDKSIFSSLVQRNKRVLVMQGHHFVPEHYYCVTYCNHCQLIIWGVGHQGYQCQNCEMNIHKLCVKVVEEYCIGALRNKKEKTKEKDKEKVKKDRRSGIVDYIKPRKTSQPVPSAIEKARRLNDEMNADNGVPYDYHHHSKSESAGRAIDLMKEPSDIVFQNMLNLSECGDKHHHNKKSAASIGRSESFRQTRESKPSFRKRSDPNIPRSKSDVDVDDKHNSHIHESHSSSNSSLSNSLDSPSNSSEMVHRTFTNASADSVPPNFAPGPVSQSTMDDSDLEADDPPAWQEGVDWDELKLMKPKEKKRQDVINELFHTERTHVRNLKVLDRIFYRPMLQDQLLPPDIMNLLFPNLEEMLEIHSTFNNKMKARRKTESIIGDIGQLMLEMFDGPAGEHLKHAAASYCENQSMALECLKQRQKKDQKLSQSLIDAEANNLCRRLQLKDIIASGFQRLTKYPLLLENIAKYTPPDTQELSDLLRAVDCSKDILVHVDSAVQEAENMYRLQDIQKKMETSAFEKVAQHPVVVSFKNLDITKYKLLHEGHLVWRQSRQKNIDMHVVLMQDIMVLFEKQSDKYILKFHKHMYMDKDVMQSPILMVQNIFTRENAIDKRTFFIVSSTEMYEFVAASVSEKKTWLSCLNNAAQQNLQKRIVKSNTGPPPPLELMSSTEQSSDANDASNKDLESSTEVESKPAEPLPSSVAEPENLKTLADEVSSDDPGPQKATPTVENGHASNRIERIEIMQVMEGPQLIEPSEVKISNAVCEVAEPVLTSFEKLKRKDLEISKATVEKDVITAEILNVSIEEFREISEVMNDAKEYTAVDLVTIAVKQGNILRSLISGELSLEETVLQQSPVTMFNDETLQQNPSSNTSTTEITAPSQASNLRKELSARSFLPITKSLNQCLSHLMVKITEIEAEREQLLGEAAEFKSQLQQLRRAHRHCPAPPPNVQSRPSSLASVTSSDGTDEQPEPTHLFAVLEKSEESSTPTTPPKEHSPRASSPINCSELTDSSEISKDIESQDAKVNESLNAENPELLNTKDTDPMNAEDGEPNNCDQDNSSSTIIDQDLNTDPVYL